MDVWSTVGLIVAVLIVIALGYYAMRPEKK
jgi:hypothetical protein